jgi:serine/threonine-protein kinase
VELPSHVGRYEVDRLLGEGRTSRVLLARDPFLGRQVAIKIARDEPGAPSNARSQTEARLRQSAQALAGLSHPGLVALFDAGDDARSGVYLVFEVIRGETLRNRLTRGPLPPPDVAQIARVIGAALSHAHGEGIVHGGVQPETIHLTPAGPKLAGLGSSPNPEPAYPAPEVRSGSVDPASDQFSFAATLREAFGEKHALRPSPRVEAVFARALAKEPRRRFQSCEAFGLALATELEMPMPWLMTSVRPPSSIVPRATRRWQNAAMAAAVLIILGLLALGRMQRSGRGGHAPAIADPRTAPPATSNLGEDKAVLPVRPDEGGPGR